MLHDVAVGADSIHTRGLNIHLLGTLGGLRSFPTIVCAGAHGPFAGRRQRGIFRYLNRDLECGSVFENDVKAFAMVWSERNPGHVRVTHRECSQVGHVLEQC